jgi:hypothetical protein
MQNPKILQHRPSWLSCGNNGGKCSEMRMAQEASPALIRPAGHIAIDRNLAANRSEDAVQSLHNSVSLGGRRLSVHFSATSSLPAAVKRHDLRPISPPHTRALRQNLYISVIVEGSDEESAGTHGISLVPVLWHRGISHSILPFASGHLVVRIRP